jgi:hypothetical protein
MEQVFAHIHEKAPADGAVLLEDDTHHILLIHDHDVSNEIVPGYYRQILEHIMACGVIFEEPHFTEV